MTTKDYKKAAQELREHRAWCLTVLLPGCSMEGARWFIAKHDRS